MEVQEVSTFIDKVKSKIKKEWKIAFISSMIFGIIIHLYIITNNFPNHDGLYGIYSTQNNLHNGRWFLMNACSISSFYTLPWVIGFISIIYLSLSSVIITELFNIKNKLNIILISGIMVSFPTICSAFSYLFMMDGFMLALLLAALSVLLATKYKYGFLIGSVTLCFSMGIYQAYLSFAILLCIIKLILSILDKKKNKEIILEVIKYFSMVVLGFILYYLFLKISLNVQHTTLSNYQGVDSLQKLSFSTIPYGIYLTYIEFASFIIKNNFFYNNIIVAICNISILCINIYIITETYIEKKIYKNIFYNILTLLLILIIPIAANIIKLISQNTYYHLLMNYHWCLFYIIFIILLEKYINKKSILQWISLVSLICIIFNFYVITNIAYFNLEYKFEKSYSLGLRIVDRIEQQENYYTGMHVAIIGLLSESYYPSTNLAEQFTKDITGTSGNIIMFDPYHYESLFKNYFNFTIVYATSEEINAIHNSQEYNEMKVWPSKDSIKIINNILVVKL